VSESSSAYQKFFQGLMDDLRDKYNFTNARAAQPQNSHSFSSGRPGITYTATFASGNRLRAELYIDVGEASKNKKIFDALSSSEIAIKEEVREPLVWERLDNRRAYRISVVRENTSISDAVTHDEEMRGWLIQRLLKFKNVFGPRLQSALNASDSVDYNPVGL
jgi:hypothetical protein